MAHRTVHLACLVSLLALTSTKEQTRWSRQLSSYTSDISDWIPLRGPIEREPPVPPPSQIKRQAIAEPRILTEPFPGLPRPSGFSADGFSSRNYFNTAANRQLYLQAVPSVPSAPQNYLTDQGFGQSFRFGLSQPNFPLNQGFVAPPFGYDNVPPPPKPARPSINMNQVNFPQASSLPLPVQGKPFLSQAPKSNLEAPKFVDGYRAENASNEFAFAKKPQSLQKIKYDNVERTKGDSTPQHSKSEREEEVQLLYVPLQQLNRGQYNFRRPMTSPQLVNTAPFAQGLHSINVGKPAFFDDYEKTDVKGLDPFSGANYFADFNSQLKDADQVSKFTTLTTPYTTLAPTAKPKKLKPHQPPLAIFVVKDVNKSSQVKVGDVLSSLKNAETIAVLDSVNPLNAPKVFIGPSNLPPPENFVKFELPYLSNIEHTDNKLKQLPFFVAPLSYNTPNGFAKIPFPSPHVGSVVINSQIKETAQQQVTPSQASQSNQPINFNYNVVTPPSRKAEPQTQKPTFSYYSTASPKTKPVPNYQSNYYSFEPQTVSSLRPPSQLETQTSPPRAPIQPQTQNVAPIRPPSQAQSQTIPPIRPGPKFETQTAPPKTGSFFHNPVSQFTAQNYPNFPAQNTFKSPEAINQYNFPRQPDHTTTLRTTTTTTTTKPPSTYPSQLLETHNPYSINQAFHFSTPLDYHSYFDDIKQPYVTPGQQQPSSTPAPGSTSNIEPKPEQISTEKPTYHQQSTQSYLNNYTPEIHYDSNENLKYPVYNPNEYVTKNEEAAQNSQKNSQENTGAQYNTNVDPQANNNRHNTNVDAPVQPVNTYHVNAFNAKYETNTDGNTYKTGGNSAENYNTNDESQGNIYKDQYKQNFDTTLPVEQDNHSDNVVPTVEDNTQQKYDEYNTYSNTDITEVSPPSSTTTTTTTKRTPIRSRGRPRYTTTPRSDSYESTTRVVVTRRPIRERRPLPTRSRYEPNKISTEKPVRKPLDSSESTTKSSRTRTRGRVHYKPSENEDIYDRRKTHNSKEEDLAYQRDVLHQNYPVTLMERASTVDIEAMTEPTVRQSLKGLEPVTETVDTENAYTNERVSISEQEEVKDGTPQPTYTARNTLQTETSYVPNLPSTRNEEYSFYQSRSSIAPVEASAYDETNNQREDDIYAKQTTPIPKPTKSETVAYDTEGADAELNAPNFSSYNEYVTVKQEDATTASETEDTKAASPEITENIETEAEDNVVQTTPSYNRVRVRPGVVRQYHQASSTESSRTKERRKPVQPVTYRPASDRRRTTMRIDEIEADLKTKQVHSRYEQEYKHPVYKPEPSTEPTSASPSTTESTKRGQFRRRRPTYSSYTTTSTEAASTKRIYEVKNRFRGRRPTEKPTEKPDAQTEAPTSTTRAPLHSRYSHRPRLSERYNKKPEPEVEVEDQDSNYSINRPKYAEPDTEQWSPKITGDSFKPYNPNDIVDEHKVATTERRSDKESDLDIITARNEFEDILLTVTPATNNNNRMNKKIPDIPPTLEAIVEQSKVTKSDASDSMSTFETMLEEVMKNLEEQDKDEYNSNVMKHKGGEIGEIPPERIISSGDGYVPKSTTPLEETATEPTTVQESSPLVDEEEQHANNNRRRGFWKKVKVRPVNSESIEVAESQYYTNTVNRLGQPINEKTGHEKTEKVEKPKVTTYKPKFDLKDIFPTGEDIDVIPTMDIHKINASKPAKDDDETLVTEESKKTTVYIEEESQTNSPGDFDLGTGSPDPTIDDLYFTTPTEPTPTKSVEKATFDLMDYLFGITSNDDEKHTTEEDTSRNTQPEIQTTEQPKLKIVTTESGFIPEEITASLTSADDSNVSEFVDIKKITSSERTDKPTEDTTVVSVRKVESSSVSSFMDPANVLSTSMSTEISHETEICFRGKCIKTKKDIL